VASVGDVYLLTRHSGVMHLANLHVSQSAWGRAVDPNVPLAPRVAAAAWL
jgi:hypothetical protein